MEPACWNVHLLTVILIKVQPGHSLNNDKLILEFNAGCGTCEQNKIKKSCVDCSEFKCNSKNKLEETVFCYEREENGQEKEGSRVCSKKKCFISADTTKGCHQ